MEPIGESTVSTNTYRLMTEGFAAGRIHRFKEMRDCGIIGSIDFRIFRAMSLF